MINFTSRFGSIEDTKDDHFSSEHFDSSFGARAIATVLGYPVRSCLDEDVSLRSA